MTPADVIKHFGDEQTAADKTGYTRQNVNYWIRNKRVPPRAQKLLELLTSGKLKAAKKAA